MQGYERQKVGEKWAGDGGGGSLQLCKKCTLLFQDKPFLSVSLSLCYCMDAHPQVRIDRYRLIVKSQTTTAVFYLLAILNLTPKPLHIFLNKCCIKQANYKWHF